MFAYCNNAPTISRDDAGTDACIIIDEEGAAGFGHVSLIIQDENGEWHYYSFGSGHGKIPTLFANICGFSVNGSMTNKVLGSSDGYDLDSNAGMNAFLAENGAEITAADMERAIYIEGDYSESQCVAAELAENIPRYHLFNYNCMDFALDVLGASSSLSKEQSFKLAAARKLGVAPRYSYGVLDNLGRILE